MMHPRFVPLRLLEWAVVFLGLPAAYLLGRLPHLPVLVPLVVVAVLAAVFLGRRCGFRRRVFWRGDDTAVERCTLRRVVRRFTVTTLVITGFLLLFYPERLLDLPRERPGLWLVIMALYPLVSVYPQELVYRAFFFHRYRVLTGPRGVMLLSAVSFAWMHIVFANGVSLLFTLIGGWYFADTYRRSGSLRLVCLEHALYGNLIFTLGLGGFFYHGGRF